MRLLPFQFEMRDTPPDLTCLDGLLTANKVAREFEFTPLHHSVHRFLRF